MKAFQAIYIFYDNFTRDSGMKIVSDGMMLETLESAVIPFILSL